MTVQKRLVTVAAVVVTEETQGPEDVAVSYAAVAEALRSHVARTLAGEGRHLLPIEYPLVRFEARSEPVPGEEAAALSVTGLREMLDEATRVMHDLAADGLTLLRVRQIRNRAGLEEL